MTAPDVPFRKEKLGLMSLCSVDLDGCRMRKGIPEDFNIESLMPSRRSNKARDTSVVQKSRSLQATAALKQRETLQHERALLAVETKVLKLRKELLDRRTQRHFQGFLDSIPCLIADIDNHQRFRFCNKCCAAFFGISRAQIVGKRLWEVFSGDDYDAIRPSLFRALDGSEVMLDKYLHGKHRRYLHCSLIPDRAPNSLIHGVFLILLDITTRKTLEDKQKQNEKRFQRLADEKAELLRQAEEAHKVKDNFLATLSHELRTPLTSIVGWSVMINSQRLSPERVAVGMKAIERNAKIQSRLIEDLLDLSRMSAGKVQLQIGDVNMENLVRQAVDSIRPLTSEKGIEIQMTLQEEIPALVGDTGRIHQVINNLLTNAVKFTPPGGHIKVNLLGTKSGVQLIVKDDGPGIPKELLPHIFEEFRQGDMSSTRPKGGLGLGLSIARHLVELHQGSISASSPKRGGATFVVSLPFPQRLKLSPGFEAPAGPRS